MITVDHRLQNHPKKKFYKVKCDCNFLYLRKGKKKQKKQSNRKKQGRLL